MRRAMTKWNIIRLTSIVLLAGVLLVSIFARGGLDNWLFQQVVSITQAYLVPAIDVEEFRYETPNVFVMDTVAFNAPSSSPGTAGPRVVEADSFALTLAETPAIGSPIQIQDITIVNGRLRLLRDPNDDKVVFRGLVPFAKTDNIKNQENVDESARLSNILRIQTITLENFAFEYDPGLGQPPMLLEGIDVTLDATETVEEEGRTWHMLNCLIDRAPLFTIDIRGRVDLDTFDAELFPSTITLALDENSRSILPPEIQQYAVDHDAHGNITISLEGALNAKDIPASDLAVSVALEDMNVSLDKYRVPITSGQIAATLSDGIASISPLTLNILGGSVNVEAQADMTMPSLPAAASWTIADLRLEDFLNSQQEDAGPDMAGRIATQGNVTMAAKDGVASLSGTGTFNLSEGRLVGVPGLSDILNLVRETAGWETGGADTVDATFDITGQGINLTAFNYDSDVIAAEGFGWLNFNQTLDLNVAGGPVKALTNRLGKVGSLISDVATGAVRYGITGTFKEPEIEVKPLGL
ncbi:MAG: hypothetical protein ACYTF7_09005 [Planctomycetota bacterium]|jgi:hypothetical protein